MIFVTLGTQDKPFKRILDLLEKADINDEVIVQSGYTDHDSRKMKILRYIPKDEFDDYMNRADYIICHAGVGTILSALALHKKVLAVPRLSKYGEHVNDHQLQIADAYRQKGYILVLAENDDLKEKLEELKGFEPEPFVSNNENFVRKLKDYIMD